MEEESPTHETTQSKLPTEPSLLFLHGHEDVSTEMVSVFSTIFLILHRKKHKSWKDIYT